MKLGKNNLICLSACLILFLIGTLPSYAENTVSHSVVDTVLAPGSLILKVKGFGNSKGDRTDIGAQLISSEPFIVYKVEWLNRDSLKAPLETFYLEANDTIPPGKSLAWRIHLDFPIAHSFPSHDQLIFHTDKGVLKCYTSPGGSHEQEIKKLQKSYNDYVEKSDKSIRILWIVALVVLIVVALIGIVIYLRLRRRLENRNREIENLSLMIDDRSERNLELRDKVNALYQRRLDTLNMLCNGYFENNDSEKMKEVFYKDVEQHILALRDNKSVEALEEIVNEYLDDTLRRIREQIPDLTVNDLKFLTYIYAGFSPRAVCIFMNIKPKTFYNRRNILKERIMASDAPDREFFVSKMFG